MSTTEDRHDDLAAEGAVEIGSSSDDRALTGFAVDDQGSDLRSYVAAWWLRVRTGDLGGLPIIVGLVLIAIIFGTLRDTFLTSQNFTNLLLQMSGTAIIAIGVVFVLLIAEIDLSVAFVSAVGGVIAALLLRPEDPGWPWPAAVGIALLVTTFIGFTYGLIVTRVGVPSFVVTLAGNLGFFGLVIIMTTQWSTAGTIVIQDDFVIGLANNFLSDFWGIVLGVIVVVGFAFSEIVKYRARTRRGLVPKPVIVIVLQVSGTAILAFGAIYYASSDRGVPMATVILLIALVFWTFIASRTRFGRHVYAVGGNPEAARRAGINVPRIRTIVFMISGFMAGVGGIILASRLRSVAPNAGGGALLLNVIAAAVIGGTSLFGGHGRVIAAFYGALVIAAVQNGMDLLGLNTGTKFVITGLVLLAAVTVDSYSKRSRAASGVA